MSGSVEAIHLAEREGEPTFPVESVEALPTLGLAGDRLVTKAQAAGETVEPHRQVTLIEAEALEGLARETGLQVSPGESRRNVCTRGVALNHLVERRFRVGDAVLRGVELCEPCGTLERLTGTKGLVTGLLHRGGLRAEIVEGGTIRVGDRVEVG